MIKVMHRINTVEELYHVPKDYGIEVDIRADGGKLVLSHEPHQRGDALESLLAHYQHALAILEIKEEGIEKEVIELCKKHSVTNYFLLSVSFPYQVLLSNQGITQLATRFSEFEDINTALSLKGRVDWVWIDTFNKNPLDAKAYRELKDEFKLCLVSPDRWGRAHEIPEYVAYFKKHNIALDAVMVGKDHAEQWT